MNSFNNNINDPFFSNKEEIGEDDLEKEMNYLLSKYEAQLKKVKSLTYRKTEIKLINIDDIDRISEPNKINNMNDSLNSSKKSEESKRNNNKDSFSFNSKDIINNNNNVDKQKNIYNSISSNSNEDINNRNRLQNMNFNPGDPHVIFIVFDRVEFIGLYLYIISIK